MHTRRNFFRIIAGAAATGVLLTNPAVAKIMKLSEPDKWTKSFVMGKEVIAHTKLYHTLGGLSSAPARDFGRTTIDPVGNNLCDFLVDNFDVATTNREEIKYMMKHRHDAFTGSMFDNEEHARKMTEGLFAVSMVRELLWDHHAPFSSRGMPAFTRFAEAYQHMIV